MEEDRTVVLTGWLLCATMADADLAAALLEEHTRLSRAEPGCLSFEVVRSMSDPMRFAVREAFVDRAAFIAHQERVKTSDWGRQTAHIERDYRIERGE
ncbi:antibiotic biosynthesis monooxygenase [Haematobacter massiliensis]|uniref:Antibiotic biosynthesis monooxygenase n=1 Tax=Haematobacter massiliensis TaxID=195105 RepID=A0A086Y7X6_9RHOB|nr:antibiotic biosynthesis monooxygenase [Haematobacter massiliensis]KFI30376.1 antibiotic biosynthesis monooxygenase [Haematobacter massiliensis]OWJ70477.1 antibiotic biosynthesis monooxygenase [Haematobacter massiliensis]OWJ87382.1 antibiotic biosynthesis monooxygenase [Haematobacter massiliensis]QBJ24835.1 antibiotic biosynthesis monooxygenase [Haematobacter massiliensis]